MSRGDVKDVSDNRKERERIWKKISSRQFGKKSGQTSLAGEDNCCADIADKLEKVQMMVE